MELRVVEKEGRKFVATAEGNRTIFIATVGFFSNAEAQAICHKAMRNLKWETSGTFLDLKLGSDICTGVGYIIPEKNTVSYDNPLDYFESVF